MFEKIEVNGKNTHHVYNFLRLNSELHDPKTKKTSEIPWNFAKFLLNDKGEVVGYWSPKTDPEALRDIIMLLIDPNYKKVVDEQPKQEEQKKINKLLGECKS